MGKKVDARPKRIALGVTGGIAAYKAIEVLRGLQRAGCEVRVAMTRHACEFVTPLTFRALSGSYVVVDDYAADNPDPIAHITFSQTIDLLVVAPATANTLAKFANGVADDFLTSTYLACTAPVLVAPAMNTTMWEHPATQRNLEKLRADGVHLIDPDAGEMACGTIGPGRLSDPERIVAAALGILDSGAGDGDLAGEHILITAGATREPIDPVRFLSNRSSGRMGFALAQAALARGADVTLVAGVTTVDPPAQVRLIKTTTALEMRDAVIENAGNATIFIGAAAVADYTPARTANQKIKKTQNALQLELARTPDILSEVARARRNGQLIIGFAAETEDLIKHATEKLNNKGLDAIVANDVSNTASGFDSENNAVAILLRDDPEIVELPLMSKIETAHRILNEIVKLRARQNKSRPAATNQ
ncbi:MAG TPA: bifunctional phosphopantothenoylcysteine decarboxylase/phosphopantothenate--cysteine ligase CoaBC [Pyrinomonadaceae bacterium]|nr:bifunctional phosphopantothenoylcysteine decarboxylase/phosphopantothenate--cysteine ligase CoaBC [Pyrinomonadaceae bacterium]